ncbi:hypothetical protein [Micromonospora sp. CPCC 205556]|uniref:hypothetical protein n=1 Tax=Micromonospora sp. CPCC 205556 TaxID=3122398 RepID=UPI002FF03058
MTTPSGAPEDDYWRRPPEDQGSPPAGPVAPVPAEPITPSAPAPTSPSPWAAPQHTGPGLPAPDVDRTTMPPPGATAGGYAGPPPTTPPPAGWRPPVHLQAAPPRALAPQDMEAMDAAEQRAQRLTYVIGAAAGVVLLLLLCLLCSRAIF